MATATNPTGRGLISADAALAALKAAGVFARKSPARGRGRCQTACYQVGDQYVNLARLRQLGAQALAAATPTPEPVATPTPEPVATPAAPVAPAPLNPAGGLILTEFRTATPGRPYLAGDGVTLWAFETETLARDAAQLIAATGATPYLAGPGHLGRPEPLPVGRPVGLPPVAPAPVAPYCLAQAGPQWLEGQAARDQARAARAAATLAAAAPEPVTPAVAAHRAAAAAGRPVSLAALARDLGQSLGLAAGGRVWGPATPLTGDPLEGQPWDPGTPAARARHADQGRRAAILWPVAQAITGAGHTLPPAWASDGPVLNGEVGPVSALAALPAAYLESAAAALAALPPVTQAQAQALELLRDALAR